MGGCWSSAVYYAQINSNGGLGTWTYTSSFSWYTGGGIMLATSVEYNGYIYEIGGQYEELGASVSPNVYYAQINSNGTLGAWAQASSLPQPSYNNTSVAYKGFIYEIGGVNGVVGQGGTFMDNVYYAQINSNGSLGTWLTTTSLPTVPSNTTRAYATSVEYAGYVYEIGGANGPAEIYSGQLNPSGGINNWNTLPNPCYHVCTINNVPTNLTFNISNSIQVKIYYVNNSNPSNATLYSCYFNANANTNYTISIPGGATVVYMELNSAGTVNYYEGTGGISIPSSSCG